MRNIAIIGGGAAGHFAAIAAKKAEPESVVTIFEKSGRVLVKVGVSGAVDATLLTRLTIYPT